MEIIGVIFMIFCWVFLAAALFIPYAIGIDWLLSRTRMKEETRTLISIVMSGLFTVAMITFKIIRDGFAL